MCDNSTTRSRRALIINNKPTIMSKFEHAGLVVRLPSSPSKTHPTANSPQNQGASRLRASESLS